MNTNTQGGWGFVCCKQDEGEEGKELITKKKVNERETCKSLFFRACLQRGEERIFSSSRYLYIYLPLFQFIRWIDSPRFPILLHPVTTTTTGLSISPRLASVDWTSIRESIVFAHPTARLIYPTHWVHCIVNSHEVERRRRRRRERE